MSGFGVNQWENIAPIHDYETGSFISHKCGEKSNTEERYHIFLPLLCSNLITISFSNFDENEKKCIFSSTFRFHTFEQSRNKKCDTSPCKTLFAITMPKFKQICWHKILKHIFEATIFWWNSILRKGPKMRSQKHANLTKFKPKDQTFNYPMKIQRKPKYSIRFLSHLVLGYLTIMSSLCWRKNNVR